MHPKYGVTYSGEDLHNGYVCKKNGEYKANVTDFKTENKIIGLNAVVVEKNVCEKRASGIEEEMLEITLFEFRNGIIS